MLSKNYRTKLKIKLNFIFIFKIPLYKRYSRKNNHWDIDHYKKNYPPKNLMELNSLNNLNLRFHYLFLGLLFFNYKLRTC